MNKKYRARVWIVLVPGKSASAMVSRMLPMPSSSSVPGSLSAETNSSTARRSCSLLSNQLRVELKALVIAYPHPDGEADYSGSSPFVLPLEAIHHRCDNFNKIC